MSTFCDMEGKVFNCSTSHFKKQPSIEIKAEWSLNCYKLAALHQFGPKTGRPAALSFDGVLQSGGTGLKLVGPFSDVIKFVKDDFVRNWLDLLCFLLSGESLFSTPVPPTVGLLVVLFRVR